VADHRFPSLIQQVIAPLAFSPPLFDSSLFGGSATTNLEEGSLSTIETKQKTERDKKKKIILFDPTPALLRWVHVISVPSIICVVIFFTYALLAGLRFTCREQIF
jgi:hypothetical protein